MTSLQNHASAPSATLVDRGLRLALLLALVAVLAYYVVFSIHWPVIWDSAVMHYVNFLTDHGFRPYRDISDSNMPGAYLVERWATVVFGHGDLGWRLFDFTLALVLGAAFVVIAWPVDWLAGFFAAALFTILHASEGPNFAVEREQVMTVLVAVSIAALLVAFRRRLPSVMLLFGAASGLAASIKPTSAPLALGVGLAAVVALHRRQVPVARYIALALAGLLLSLLPIVWFFVHTHSFADFLFVTRSLLPSYVAARQGSYAQLLRILLPRNMVLFVPVLLVLALLGRRWNFERWLLFAAMFFGAVSYFAQHKGIIYHRYPFVAFFLLLLGLEIFPALRSASVPQRLIAALSIAFLLAVSLPHYVLEMRRTVGLSAVNYTRALTSDLQTLGPSRLDRQVECFDLTDGCFSALLHLDLVQNNGFTGDLLFFSPTDSPTVRFYRQQFWQKAQVAPPGVLVLTNSWFQVGHTFRKLTAWPEFQQYLAANYVEAVSRAFPNPADPTIRPGDDQPSRYRIYIRRGSPLLNHPPFAPEPASLGDAAFDDAGIGSNPLPSPPASHPDDRSEPAPTVLSQ